MIDKTPWIDVDQIKPHPDNPNEHTPEQIKKIARSIDELDWGRPIIISSDNYILIGHGAYEAAKDILYQNKVPYRRVEHIHSSSEAIALMLSDNKLAELSNWNYGKLQPLQHNLEIAGFDTTLTGFEETEIQEIETKLSNEEKIVEDEFDSSTETESICKRGEIYQLGRHRLMCGDSTQPNDFKLLMNGKKADMVFTSPPYWVGKDYEYQENEKEINDFIEKISANIVKFTSPHLSRIIINTGTGRGSQFTGKVETLLLIDKWTNTLKEKGWLLRHLRIWVKTGGLPAQIAPKTDIIDQHCEFIGTFYNPDGEHRGQNKLNEKWVLQGYIDDIRGNAGSEGHGATFPIELPSRFIKLYSHPNNIILEPFGGTGTTLMACEQLDRTCYIMEMDPHYCDIIIKRWEEFTGQKAGLK